MRSLKTKNTYRAPKRADLMKWDGCTVDFTITAKGKSVRQYTDEGHEAMTRDVLCAEYPRIEVRKTSGGYVCQYRVCKAYAVKLAFGCSMGSAVSSGLGNVCRNGWDATDLDIQARTNARKPDPEQQNALLLQLRGLLE